ncbi:MAG TPA: hypothetical protein VLJ38_13020, partial [Polyangiaceae bacterium]|nr:hypothetical protein [Polyangiaceae bacterium]
GGSSGGTGGSSGGTGGSAGQLQCDADQDGARSDAATCGGDDCNDGDANVYPTQAGFFTSKNKSGTFDYNCDGDEEREFTTTLDCSLLNLVDCSGEGFDASLPACGQSGNFIRCDAISVLPTLSLSCAPVSEGTRVMGCR